MSELPRYSTSVAKRAGSVAAGTVATGGIGAAAVAVLSTEAGFWTVMNVLGGPAVAGVAVVGAGIAVLSKKIANNRRRNSSETILDDPSPVDGFEPF